MGRQKMLELILTSLISITITLIIIYLNNQYHKSARIKLTPTNPETWENFYAKAEVVRKRNEAGKRERERDRAERLDHLERGL